ncbi:MAG: ABC transporter transmembrane domain-containing protein, partial [bacterium]
MSSTPAISSMSIYRRLLRYAKPYTWHLVGAALCMSLSAALNVGALFQLQPIFDKIFSGTSSPKVVDAALRFYPPLIVILIISKGFFSFVGNVLGGTASNKLTADIREAVYGKLLDLPLAYHSNSQAGELMARVTSDVNLMPAGISDVLGKVFGAGFNIISIVAGVFWINWRLALIMLVA